MTRPKVFILAFLVGAMSWAICPILSGRFEPFDAGAGLVVGQAAFLAFGAYVGWTKGLKSVLLAVGGIYLGQIVYAYAFGSSETQAWAVLGLVTISVLCIVPLVAGLLAVAVSFVFGHRKDST